MQLLNIIVCIWLMGNCQHVLSTKINSYENLWTSFEKLYTGQIMMSVGNALYYMKYSCIPNGHKMRKIISPVAISFLNQSAFSIFARFSMVRALGALSRLLFLTQAKIFKKLFIPIVNVVKWKKKSTEMPSRFVGITDGELTQFLEKL